MLRSIVAFAFWTGVSSWSLAQGTVHAVLTYNIRYDNPDDGPDRWAQRKEAVAEVVKAHRPTIVGLQEALQHQLAFLDQEWPGYRRFGVGRDDGLTSGEFAPIYYDTAAFRLVEGRSLWLSETPEQPSIGWDASCPRIATLASLIDVRSGDSLWVINTHWDHMGALARQLSASMLRGLVAGQLSRGCAVLVLGDLNAEPGSPPIERMSRWFEDACPADKGALATFNAFRSDAEATSRIDYVWYTREQWELERYEVLHPRAGKRQASDHFPVLAHLRLLPQRR